MERRRGRSKLTSTKVRRKEKGPCGVKRSAAVPALRTPKGTELGTRTMAGNFSGQTGGGIEEPMDNGGTSDGR